MNTVQLIGRLTHDPELRYSPSGISTVRFRLAVNRDFTNAQGEREADFITCVAFKKVAENLANYQKKGSRIGVVGKIQTGSYDGQNGKVYTTDVIANSIEFLDSRSNGGDSSNSAPNYQSNTNYQTNNQNSTQGQYGGQNQPPGNAGQFGGQQQNYQDPFAGGGGPLVDESDLPF